MKYLAAYSLLVLSGKAAPSKPFSPILTLSIAADDVAKLLKEVGVQSSKDEIETMIKAVSGKKLHELVRDGSKKLASVPSGAGVAVAAPAGGAPKAAAGAPAAPAKKEEKPKEEEADVDMGGLFGDDY
jgi:large subunit ribosomal protein LP2